MTSIDQLGSECMVLTSKINGGESRLKSERKDYNQRRRQYTTELREKLIPVWAALKAGESVNGQVGIEQWCKLANPDAKYPERQFQRIMNPVEKKETTSCRVVKLVEGMVVKFPIYLGDDEEKQHEMTFKISSLPEGDNEFRKGRGESKGRHFANIILEVIEGTPQKEVKPKGRRCKMLIQVLEGGKVTLPTCEQPSIYTKENGWACLRHQEMLAKPKAAPERVDKPNKAMQPGCGAQGNPATGDAECPPDESPGCHKVQ